MDLRADQVESTKHPLRRPLAVAVLGAVLIAASFGVTSASATLVKEVAGTVRSVVPPVTVPAAPSLPSSPPPSTPPAPIAVPAAPQAPVKLPTGATSTPSPSPSPKPAPSSGATKVSTPVADLPSVGGVTGATKKVASPVRRGATSNRQSGQGTGAPTSEAATAEDDALASRAAARKAGAASTPPSIKPARAAPLRQLFAHVWPAFALGGNGAVLAGPEGAPQLTALDELAAFSAARLFVLGISGASADREPSERSGTPNDASPGAPNNAPAPAGREITLFVIFSFAALLALLMSTVWVELRARYR